MILLLNIYQSYDIMLPPQFINSNCNQTKGLTVLTYDEFYSHKPI